jgi:hypothetical protein
MNCIKDMSKLKYNQQLLCKNSRCQIHVRSLTNRFHVSHSSLRSFDYLPSRVTCFLAIFDSVSPNALTNFLYLLFCLAI